VRKTFAAFLLTALSFDGAPNRPADTIRFGPNGAFRLEYTSTSFGREASGVIEVVKGRVKKYPLPQSSFATYARLRPGELKNMQISAKDYERLEWIGPHQVEGSRLWFGKQFYDGEGMTGVARLVILTQKRVDTISSRRLKLLRMRRAPFWWNRIASGWDSTALWRTSVPFQAASSAGAGQRMRFDITSWNS